MSTNQIDNMIAWENGEMSEVDEIKLFSELIRNGAAWLFHGCYGRTASSFIQNNIISRKGEILVNLNEIYD
jgi:hypothetical protein